MFQSSRKELFVQRLVDNGCTYVNWDFVGVQLGLVGSSVITVQSGDLHQWTWTVCCHHECGTNYRWEGCTHTITIFIDILLMQARLILSPGHCTYMYLTLNSTTITIFIDI